MSFSVNSNTAAATANFHLNQQNKSLGESIAFLSSGSKLGQAAYDASSLTIANQLSSQVSGMGQSIMNANDSIGMSQIAESGLSSINDNMEQIRTLSIKASSPIMNASNRASIQKEINGLLEVSGSIASNSSFNGVKLLDGGSGSLANGNFSGSIDVMSEDGLASALETIDGELGRIGGSRSDIGASQNQLVSSIQSMSVSKINAASAESQMRDVDFAKESANFSAANLQSQIGSFTAAQANAQASNVMRLFQ